MILDLSAAGSEESSIPYRNKSFCANPAAEQRGMRSPEFTFFEFFNHFTRDAKAEGVIRQVSS